MTIIKKWIQSSKDRVGLDILFSRAPLPSTPLRARLDWIVNIVNWVRTVSPEVESVEGRIPVSRLRYILQILDRNPDMKEATAKTLRSIVKDTSALDLFLHVGIPKQGGFLEELLERIHLQLLPEPPRDTDLVQMFSLTFRLESDAEWIRQMDSDLFNEWIALFRFKEGHDESNWNSLIRDARDALFLATQTVRSMGLSDWVRNRVAVKHFSDLPFYSLMDFTGAFLNEKNDTLRVDAYSALDKQLESCHTTLLQIHSRFREEGVSISLVYETERLRALLIRIGVLSRLLAGYQFGPEYIKEFFGMLVEENIRVRSIKGLLADNFNLLSKKIVETNAEVGEHYITRDRTEYASIIGNALGGGAITGVTILLKFLISHLSVPLFYSGLFSFFNYAFSFVTMQILGFTLATKQPAMTATVLASKIKESRESIDAVLEESTHLIRSQIAAIFGNLMAVIPAMILIHWLYTLGDSTLTDPAYARKTIESFSLFGMTPIYAAWTGVLLWLSSVFAGAFGNWVTIRRIPQALEVHPRLHYMFGETGTKKFATFVKRHASGFAANISLAFFLGMSPQIAGFFGLPLDVRHVTLSTGSLTVASLTIGNSVFHDHIFWHAVLGVGSMAVLNLLVAFALALMVALRAQHAVLPKQTRIYSALFNHFLRHPLQFVFPPKGKR